MNTTSSIGKGNDYETIYANWVMHTNWVDVRRGICPGEYNENGVHLFGVSHECPHDGFG